MTKTIKQHTKMNWDNNGQEYVLTNTLRWTEKTMTKTINQHTKMNWENNDQEYKPTH